MNITSEELGYNPEELPRETQRHYISASEDDIQSMLSAIGVKSLEALYDHIPKTSSSTKHLL